MNAPILGVDVQLQNLEVNWSHILVMSAIIVRSVNATEGVTDVVPFTMFLYHASGAFS